MIVKTPGVYIKEKNVLPASVVGISTAVPVFIGFTAKGDSTPKRIKSMFEFVNNYGGKFSTAFNVEVDASTYSVGDIIPNKRFFLYETLYSYFTNGGGPCHIISADIYANVTGANAATSLQNALPLIDALDEVTLTLIPDLHFQFADSGSIGNIGNSYSTVSSALITKCAALKDKFAILDYLAQDSDTISTRNAIVSAPNELKYGALYYPWLKNNMPVGLSADQLALTNNSGSSQEADYILAQTDLDILVAKFGDNYSVDTLWNEFNRLNKLVKPAPNKSKITAVFSYLYTLVSNLDSGLVLGDTAIDTYRHSLESNINFIESVKNLFWFTDNVKLNGNLTGTFPSSTVKPNDAWISAATNFADYSALIAANTITYTVAASNEDIIADLKSGNYVDLDALFTGIASLFEFVNHRKSILEEQLFNTDTVYIEIKKKVTNYLKQIPSQGAVAGVYCKNDRDRGVWKSPANIAVQGIEKPLFEVSNADQDLLNVDASTGKSINVIRTFTGKGPLVWGARTLDGNSNEWRYIAVRRFFNFAEESIKKAMNDFVFEPNNARTWVKIKAMVTSFLVDQWRAGALVGTDMDQAFFVRVGKDTTTDTDVLNGIINVQIGMAVARPAEFILIEFSHKTK